MLNNMYDHYKDTCSICRSQVKERNVMFIRMLAALAGAFLLSVQTNEVLVLLVSYIEEEYKCSITFSADLISTFLWLILLYFTLEYYRRTINLERQYTYIHNLENAINIILEEERQNLAVTASGSNAQGNAGDHGQALAFRIDREGKAYLKDYPKLLDAADLIYKTVFPIFYILLMIIGIWKSSPSEVDALMFIRLFTAAVCIGLSLLFIVEIRKQ